MRARLAALVLVALGGALAALLFRQPHPKATPDQYRAYCARCHGAHGEGTAKSLARHPAADLRASEMMKRGDRAALRRRIAAGYGPMPAFSRTLSPAEIERMIDFLLHLRATERKGP